MIVDREASTFRAARPRTKLQRRQQGATLSADVSRRPRHALTETDELAHALDAAAATWPEHRDDRARLLLCLVQAGHRAIRAEEEARVASRREAVRCTSGALTGVYPPGYLERLRDG